MRKLASHFGVYALILNDARDQVLLIKKALGCYTGLYDLPGGTMEPHENLEETLIRETLEETNLSITSHRQLGTFCTFFDFIKDEEERTLRHLAAIYECKTSGEPRWHAADDDSNGCVWVNVTDISSLNAAPLVCAALQKALEDKQSTR